MFVASFSSKFICAYYFLILPQPHFSTSLHPRPNREIFFSESAKYQPVLFACKSASDSNVFFDILAIKVGIWVTQGIMGIMGYPRAPDYQIEFQKNVIQFFWWAGLNENFPNDDQNVSIFF